MFMLVLLTKISKYQSKIYIHKYCNIVKIDLGIARNQILRILNILRTIFPCIPPRGNRNLGLEIPPLPLVIRTVEWEITRKQIILITYPKKRDRNGPRIGKNFGAERARAARKLYGTV